VVFALDELKSLVGDCLTMIMGCGYADYDSCVLRKLDNIELRLKWGIGSSRSSESGYPVASVIIAS
jgi:hypothetical protein